MNKQLALQNGSTVAVRKSHAGPSRARTRIWQRAFLKALREVPNVTAACAVAHISRRHVYYARDNNPEFQAAWLDALQQSVDKVEAKVFELAIEGNEVLAMFLLRSHRRGVYGDRMEIDARVGGIIFLPQKASGPE